ncbi:aladin [Diachasma alloeum]|uniref:aladin n=1 Tax=Diachasma alloeum TaxID=454923 RepID=UPI0007384C68|nr:aladin [Diachasma alloeum]
MLKVNSLHDFEPPPEDERATAGIIEGRVVFCERRNLQDETQPFFRYIRGCPEVNVTPETLATRESARAIAAADLFLTVEDSAFKKIASVWREKGVLGAIRTAAGEDPQRVSRVVHWVATRITAILDFVERKTSYEGIPSVGSGSVADIAGTRDWTTALIRCLAWHPHCTRLALATRDDRIRIYSSEIQGVAVLRHSAQKSVCSMSWRPNAGRELAAACGSGVLVWTVELGAASNSLSHAILLRQRNHAPVTSVNWHPQGDLLVSCSPNDFNMIVWDVAKEVGVPLRRVGGGGLCFTKWSICGSKLLAATCRNVFRVWNTGTGNPWSVERWTVPNGRVAAACFGPHQILLFASTENPATLFSLSLQDNVFNVKGDSPANDPKAAIPLIDLTRVSFNDDDAGLTVGGRVIATEWDPSGQYLAILFQDSPVVAIFKTEIGRLFGLTEVRPTCLVKGFPGETPNCLQFHQNIDTDRLIACLTIAWSSGRVQQFPIVGGNKSVTPTRVSRPLNTSVSSPGFKNYTFL